MEEGGVPTDEISRRMWLHKNAFAVLFFFSSLVCREGGGEACLSEFLGNAYMQGKVWHFGGGDAGVGVEGGVGFSLHYVPTNGCGAFWMRVWCLGP